MKKILSILLVVLMGLPMTVKADTYPIDDTDWKVEFDGKQLKANYTSQEVADAMSGMQPGDTADLEITVINNYKDVSTWWLGNEVIESFEDSSKASDGAYRYSLSYTDPNGNETVLYSSLKVGGTGSDTGLHEATDALDELFVMGVIPSGKSGKVNVHIELDGETQNNSYQDTLAELQINFAVELPDQPERRRIPKTGSEEMIRTRNLYLIACSISFLILMILAAYLYRESRRRRSH